MHALQWKRSNTPCVSTILFSGDGMQYNGELLKSSVSETDPQQGGAEGCLPATVAGYLPSTVEGRTRSSPFCCCPLPGFHHEVYQSTNNQKIYWCYSPLTFSFFPIGHRSEFKLYLGSSSLSIHFVTSHTGFSLAQCRILQRNSTAIKLATKSESLS